jgi:hypothetical protein
MALAALCILSGTSWVIPGGMTNELPPLERQSLLFGGVGLVALVVAGRRLWLQIGSLQWIRLAAAAVGFFGVPIVVAEYVQGSVPATSRSALFAMVPVVVVLVVAASDEAEGEQRGARQLLVPALTGLGGLLLLLPLDFSGSVRGYSMLALVCAAVILAGAASVWLHRLLRGFPLAEAIAIVGLSNAIFLSGSSAAHEDVVRRWGGLGSILSISSLVDVVEVLLIVWLLREMLPTRFASRYLVIPLVTVLEGYALVRPDWTVRMVVGTLLLAGGAGGLLFWKAGEEETVLSLR